jgi:murein DD-endopeptidase MepM/ murein hydrolase activator NlpD
MPGWIVLVLCLAMGLGLWEANCPTWADAFAYAPVAGVLSSDFGWRNDPLTGSPRFHGGIDIAAPLGSPVYATQWGQVVFSGEYGGYGQVVVVSHGAHPSVPDVPWYTLMGHLSQRLVAAGTWVRPGDVLGRVGATGRATGPHLHFEVRQGNQYVHPLAYLQALAGTPSASPNPSPWAWPTSGQLAEEPLGTDGLAAAPISKPEVKKPQAPKNKHSALLKKLAPVLLQQALGQSLGLKRSAQKRHAASCLAHARGCVPVQLLQGNQSSATVWTPSASR